MNVLIEDQRKALEQIFTGKVGGWAGEFGSLISELRGIEYAPIKFDAADDLAYWRAEIPNKVSVGAEALTGPTADPKRRVQLHNPPGSETGPGQIATWGVVKRIKPLDLISLMNIKENPVNIFLLIGK
ncbi:DUF1326 domain-containing protein [Bacillus cereus]